MELFDKVKITKDNYNKMVSGDDSLCDAVSFDISYMFPQIADYISKSSELLEAYCAGVESGELDLTAHYIDICKLLDRPVNLGITFE